MSLVYVLLLGLCLSAASAIEMPVYISLPSQVTAGTSFQATLDADVYNGDTTYAKAFRVYLATSYKDKAHYFYDSDCYLIHEQTLCDPSIEIESQHISFTSTPFNVTIPPTVGPSGEHYVLVARIHQSDGSRYGSALESEVFDLAGANGNWNSFQKTGYTLWGDDGIPCGSYACVKDCEATAEARGATNTTLYQGCANKCPSVSIDFENSTYGGQPTASLTKPSACSTVPSATAIDSKTTDVDVNPTATRTRSAAAAAGTSAAASRHNCRISFSICLVLLVSMFIMGW